TTTYRHMLGPLIAAAAEEAGAQDDDLALARRQRAFAAQDIPAPNQEGPCRSRMGQQGAEDIENRAPGQHGLDNLALLVGPRFGRGGRYARGGQSHVISRISPGRFSIDWFCAASMLVVATLPSAEANSAAM